MRRSHVLIILDGFDEIADDRIRAALVEEISGAAGRLLGAGMNAQFVVTSRPTAFLTSPRFPSIDWAHFELAALEPPQVFDYVERWARAKRMVPGDVESLRQQVESRLQETHVSDLSRNPMQLAILLTLIRARGESLPEKRTALYKEYISMFMSRESEKDAIIRDNREIILELHGYLAWEIQRAVEAGLSNGRLPEAQLRALVEQYLNREEYHAQDVQALFEAMRQRIVAIVSRVTGTYEFEVQPLREFFVGWFLYETAPASTLGNERSGSVYDRFKALAPSAYWENSARFYAGFYSKGELPSLVACLDELQAESVLSVTSHLSVLGLTLVEDWVFAQHIPSQKAVIDSSLAGPRWKLIAAQTMARSGFTPELHVKLGRERLLQHISARFGQVSHTDELNALGNIIVANLDDDERVALWRSQHWKGIYDPRALAEVVALEIVDSLPLEDIESLVENARDQEPFRVAIYYLSSGSYKSDRIVKALAKYYLDGGAGIGYSTVTGNDAAEVWAASTLGLLSDLVFSEYAGLSVDRISIQRYFDYERIPASAGLRVADEFNLALVKTVRDIDWVWDTVVEDWKTQIAPWERLEGAIRTNLGENWLILRIAVSAAVSAKVTDVSSGVSGSMSAVMVQSKIRAADAKWWRALMEQHQPHTILAAMFSFAPEQILVEHWGKIEDWLLRMNSVDFAALYHLVWRATMFGILAENTIWAGGSTSGRGACLLRRRRINDMHSHATLPSIEIIAPDQQVMEALSQYLLEEAALGTVPWSEVLPLIKELYRHDISRVPDGWYNSEVGADVIPVGVAEEILLEAELYPLQLIVQAEVSFLKRHGSSSVGESSEREQWFPQ